MKARGSATAEIDAGHQAIVSLRNDFMHFTPKGLVDPVGGLPRIFENALLVVEHLDRNGHVFWYEASDQVAAFVLP